MLCRYWPHKTDSVAQYVITETYIYVVLRLVHDEIIAGHPGKERTLLAACRKYYWPTMRVDTNVSNAPSIRVMCQNQHQY